MTDDHIYMSRLGGLVDDGLVLVEARSGKIISANPAAARMLGGKITGRKITGILTAPELKEHIAGFDDNENAKAECISGLKGDRFTRVRVRLGSLDDGRLVVVLSDMTRAHNLEKVRRDFVANVSHELRSPLTALVGFIETMRTSPALDDATRGRFLGIMDEETKRMSRLIDDLMSLSRVEVEEHIAPTEEIYIVNVVEAVVATMSNRAALEGRSVVFSDRRKPRDDSVTVLGVTDEIMEVFHNLLDNALKYGAAESEIRVVLADNKADDKAGELRFDVINEGEGIAPHHMERLTERFYRVDKARSQKIGGTGLGLAIVKHIVSRHRGRLEITSDAGGLTVFSVILPKAGAVS